MSCVGLTCPFPKVSLSIGLVNLVGYTVVDWAFANLFSQILIVLHWVLAGRSALLFLLVQFTCDLLSVFTFNIVISVALSLIYGLLSIDLIYMLY